MLVVTLFAFVLGIAAVLTFAAFGDVGRTQPSTEGSSDFFNSRDPADSSTKTDRTGERKKLFAADSVLMQRAGVPPQQQRMLSFLEDHCPVIPVRAGSARVLAGPSDFYSELTHQITQARHSIFFSALYIGDGALSNAFVGALEDRIAAAVAAHEEKLASRCLEPSTPVTPFEVGILLDYNRMHDRANLVTVRRLLTTAHMTEHRYNSRPTGRSASQSMLDTADATTPNFSPVKVRLYLFQGPCRWNRLFALFGRAKEVLGVQHTKIFAFDGQHTILTGANLSDDYFATRMDRYIIYERNEHLTYFFLELLKVLFAVSHPVVSLTEYVGQLGGAMGSVVVEPQSPLQRIRRLTKEREKWRACGTQSGNDRPHSRLQSKDEHTSTTKTTYARDARVPTATQQRLQAQMVFPFGKRNGSDRIEPACGSPTLHKASDLVILPNALGFDPSRETAAYQARTKELCMAFARRMSERYQNMAYDLLTADASHLNAHEDCEGGNPGGADVFDSVVFPTVQLGRAGIFHDSFVVKGLLGLASSADHVFLTSPYLNFYSDFLDVLMGKAETDSVAIKAKYPVLTDAKKHSAGEGTKDDNAFRFDCVTASVATNGWSGQRGFAGFIPFFYLQLERVFYFLVKAYGCVDRVRIHEFTQAGLTFHAKGIYFVGHGGAQGGGSSSDTCEDLDPSKSTTHSTTAAAVMAPHASPYLVAYGSTNYGYRSVHKDVEAEGFFFTFNRSVRAQTRLELGRLLQHSTTVGEKQFVGGGMGRFQPVISLVAQMGQDFL